MGAARFAALCGVHGQALSVALRPGDSARAGELGFELGDALQRGLLAGEPGMEPSSLVGDEKTPLFSRRLLPRFEQL